MKFSKQLLPLLFVAICSLRFALAKMRRGNACLQNLVLRHTHTPQVRLWLEVSKNFFYLSPGRLTGHQWEALDSFAGIGPRRDGMGPGQERGGRCCSYWDSTFSESQHALSSSSKQL